jgi:hypothetical protein
VNTVLLPGIRSEAQLMEMTYRRGDPGRRRDLNDRQKYIRRREWKDEFRACIRAGGPTDDELMCFLDKMIKINRDNPRKKKHKEQFPARNNRVQQNAANQASLRGRRTAQTMLRGVFVLREKKEKNY